MDNERDSVDKLTKDEVKAIEDKQGKMLLSGGLTLIAGIGLSFLSVWLTNNTIVAVIALSLGFFVGGGLMIFAPNVHECGRCGEYYTVWWKHPEDVCLCNLKSKLIKLDCK